MAWHDTIGLSKKVKVDGKWVLLPVAFDKKKREFKTDTVLVDGREQFHPEGNYHLDYYDGGKRQRPSTGLSNLNQVVEVAERQAAALEATRVGLKTTWQDLHAEPDLGPTAEEACTKFLREWRLVGECAKEGLGKSEKTMDNYALLCEKFIAYTEQIKKPYVRDYKRDDFAGFVRFVSELPNVDSANTINSICRGVGTMYGYVFERYSVFKNLLPRKFDKAPPIYTEHELATIHAHSPFELQMVWDTYLWTGMRESELTTLRWIDVDFDYNMINVRFRPEYGFKPKNRAERTIPMIPELKAKLEVWRETAAGRRRLVFGTDADRPSDAFPTMLKKIAFEQKLNCGLCLRINRQKANRQEMWTTRCSEGPYCGNFFLHKFRHTYATVLLRGGARIDEVQRALGHTDLDSTLKYLRNAPDEHVATAMRESGLGHFGRPRLVVVPALAARA